MLSKSEASQYIVTLILSFVLSYYINNLLRIKLKMYIANRAFGDLRKFSAIYKHRQIVDLAFKNE